MGVDTIPLRWPAAWKDDPGMLDLLQATPIRQLLIDSRMDGRVSSRAARDGIAVAQPSDVAVVKGTWPGIRISPQGGDRAAAGPTGEPWVDSNGWRIRAARAQRPGVPVWVDAAPQPSRTSTPDYILAFADAVAHGGRWIITLDDVLASGLAAKKPDAMAQWREITRAAAFFAPVKAGDDDEAVIGVVSNFAGPKLGFTNEVLNNIARTKQQYRAIAAGRMTPSSLTGLKAVIYTDGAEPASTLRKTMLDFVNAGGMLITGSAWGSLPKATGEPARTHPRFTFRTLGQGSIASASTTFADPYLAANDAVVLVSHRHDLVRYFNSGAITPCLYGNDRRAQLHTVFYSLRPVEDASLWVRGAYRTARLRTWNQQQPQNVKIEVRDAGIEIFLPAVAQYALLELEA